MATNHFDDPGISDDERLLRRIHWSHLVEGDASEARISTAAFKDQELSVNIESTMREAGRAPEDSLHNNPNNLLVSITARTCRSNDQIVGRDPVPSEPAHGYVFGKKGRPIQRNLRDSAVWVVPKATPSWPDIEALRIEKGAPGTTGNDS